ncbi:16S rRNA (uracil(1498)-N(3))-methyltransferase [Gordonia crocea]|uniref:Ribosomal RNA small subunit methyltransferase E n=1 Tax=Gordonia crocea TaxID=589162 RepID=A0A7I9UZY6_9ACTN|nr:16S rRNA (uracil(1498)-N(3))-methyltransferase [Gordonia crocea]GED98463.1 ribosomal RNA small subunit methyltransferase E [Gordonia crocea]
MSPPLFWVDEAPAAGTETELTGAEGRHAVTVTRIAVGETVILGDGAGASATCEVVATRGKDTLRVRAVEYRFVDRPRPLVTVVQALPKSERSELFVELATEAGADVIVPWQSSRSVARWVGSKADKGVAKWRSAAATAAKQSRRAWIPEIADLASTTSVRARCAEAIEGGGIVVALHESGSESFHGIAFRDAPQVVLVVGPEGGLAEDELVDLAAIGAHTAVLGPQVLRTSTTAAVALGALGALSDRWDRGRP